MWIKEQRRIDMEKRFLTPLQKRVAAISFLGIASGIALITVGVLVAKLSSIALIALIVSGVVIFLFSQYAVRAYKRTQGPDLDDLSVRGRAKNRIATDTPHNAIEYLEVCSKGKPEKIAAYELLANLYDVPGVKNEEYLSRYVLCIQLMRARQDKRQMENPEYSNAIIGVMTEHVLKKVPDPHNNQWSPAMMRQFSFCSDSSTDTSLSDT